MKLIWFNSVLNVYQKGTVSEFEKIENNQFEVIYEFKNTSDKIIDKVVASLNIAKDNQGQN